VEEVFPVLSGVVIGLATFHVRRRWLNIALVGSLGLAFGAMASWISGELASLCAGCYRALCKLVKCVQKGGSCTKEQQEVSAVCFGSGDNVFTM
jgi:hypothetical protein